MANDSDWVEDVRRWYYGGSEPTDGALVVRNESTAEPDVIGYEAAHPALQARHWPDAPVPQGLPTAQ